MVREVARRLSMPREHGDLLAFLLESHLVMATLAHRRDLNDEKLIVDFARTVQDEDTLKMLYLLTLADLRSVGPEALSDWKASLLEELYLKTADLLQRGDLTGGRVEERIQRARAQVRDLLKNELSDAEIESELRATPPRYLLGCRPEEIVRHIRMARELKDVTYHAEVTHNTKDNYSQFTICTKDRVGLFSQLTGVMAANNINILAAQINTREDGVAIDVFLLNDALGNMITDPEKWAQVHRHLEGALTGVVDVGALVASRQRPPALPVKKYPRFPAHVFIDNQVSDHYTVIEVVAHDRIGLLYDISKTITSLGLTIDFSKIATKVDQAVDVFYVRDKQGGKVLEPEKLQRIEEVLLKAV